MAPLGSNSIMPTYYKTEEHGAISGCQPPVPIPLLWSSADADHQETRLMESHVDMDATFDRKARRDYSAPVTFDLSTERPDKTVDIGKDGTWVSADPFGRILQLSAFHPKHGVVVAVPYEQFDGTRFRDPLYVREYRTHMLESVAKGRPGYGIVVKGKPKEVSIIIPRPNVANIRFRLDDSIEVHATLVVHDGEAVQSVTIRNSGATAGRTVEGELSLCTSVNRASYGQLTEGGPLPIPRSENALDLAEDGGRFAVSNRHLEARLEGCFYIGDKVASLCGLLDDARERHHHGGDKIANGGWGGPGRRAVTVLGAPISASTPWKVGVPAGSSVELTARFRLRPIAADGAPAGAPVIPLFAHHQRIRQTVVGAAAKLLSVMADWKDPQSVETYMVRRTLDYIIGNCLVPLSEDCCAIVTDHVALPLGWNRDNYWQVRFLSTVLRSLDSLVHPGPVASFYATTIRRVLRGHLNWVFRRAERPAGYWHRSYLVTGKPKDGRVFQLDQQLYPLVELCDFAAAAPQHADDASELVRGVLLREPVVCEVLRVLLAKADPITGLVPTEESPGDDEIDYPYHFSTHVMLWYALSRLVRLLESLGVVGGGSGTGDFEAAAAAAKSSDYGRQAHALATALLVRTASRVRHFLVRDEQGRPTFAYVTNGKGKYTLYHDGNDMPTLFVSRSQLNLAGILNGISAQLGTADRVDEDEIEEAWRNTMRFAFSTRNASGFCSGSETNDKTQPQQQQQRQTQEQRQQLYPFGGLGSVHSSGAWTLGYFQELMFARIEGDAAAERDAWRRVVGAMQWDGSFAEAVDARSGRCASKAWFSWPASMIGAALVDAREAARPREGGAGELGVE
ncbi:hypothetical protein RB597_002719 [Gaeumannomyces tritici]